MPTTQKAYTESLLAFAAGCAADEMAYYAQASSHPNPSPCAGMWQSFRAEFPEASTEEWDLVVMAYGQTVNVLADHAGVEAISR